MLFIRFQRAAILVAMILLAVILAACQPVQTSRGEGAATSTLPMTEPEADAPNSAESADAACEAMLATMSDFMRADDYDAVVELLDKVLDCGVPGDLKASLLFLRAESNMKRGDWQTAIDDYRDALAFGLEAEDAAGARNNICWFYALDNQASVALPYCEEAVSASHSASYLDSRGLTYALLGEYDKAVADFEDALSEWAQSENPQIQAIAAERQQWVEALRSGENPITQEELARMQAEDAPALSADLESSNPAAEEQLLLGRQYHMTLQFDEAEQAYSKAIELDPEYTLAYFYRGLVNVWREQWDDALADMQHVAILDPEQAHARHVAGLMYMREEAYDEAVASYTAAIELLPDQADFYADRAAAFFALGEFESALGDLNTVLSYDPDAAQMLFMRAAAYRALDNRGEAIADLERALELGLPFDLAEQARKALRELREGFF
ncbi:MAG: tetratricopeptide repeat protein [Caldilineaceae bacterium]